MSFHRLLCSAFAVVFACMAATFFADRAEAAEGLASWYAPDPANAGEFTAVHDTLPVGTVLTVSYGERWVQVAVIGRGSDLDGRDLDISQAPAEFLGLTKVGADFVSYTYPGEAADASTTHAPIPEYSGLDSATMEGGYDTGYAAPKPDYATGHVEPYYEPSAAEAAAPEAAAPDVMSVVGQPVVATYAEPAVDDAPVWDETSADGMVADGMADPETSYGDGYGAEQPEVATYAESAVDDAPAWDETSADGAVADGAVADGAVADGAVADGAVADGAVADGAVADGAVAPEASYGGEEYVEPQVASSGYAPGYEEAVWYPASDYGNYTAADRPSSNPVDKIVVHATEGSYESAMNWFQDPTSGVSAHYTVRSSDGVVGQSVSEMNIAHHAGNWEYNQTSVGIEHEGYVSDPSWYTDAMYQSSAQVGAHLVNTYGIPVDRKHIIGHDEVPGATHTDPGPYWDWDLYLAYVQDYAGASPAAPAEPAPAW